MSPVGLAWPLAFAAFGALMFVVCTYRRNRVRGMAIAALEQAHATMLAIGKGVDSGLSHELSHGPFAEQLGTISSIGRHLAARTRYLSAIIEAQPECVKVVDADGNLVHMNRAGLQMIAARSMSEVRGALVEDLILEEYREAYRDMHARVLQGEPGSLTFEIVGLDGEHHWMETSAVPFPDRTGKTVQLAVTRDITERRRQEEATRAAQAKAESANRSKSVFLANMSHELRTPLTAIIGFADLLKGTAKVSGEDEAALQAIHSSGEHLLALINDVLDVSKIEAGQLEIETITFDLRELVQRTVQSLRPGAMKAGLTVKLSFADDLPSAIRSDPMRIRQVLINLLSNAIKFTHEGSIEVLVMTAGIGSSIAIAVTDTGIGIGTAALDRIFSPFQQADASTTRHYGGSGLGLAISREIAELMGGELSATSQLGEGSTFTFSIPLHRDEGSAAIGAAEPRSTRNRFQGRALVVEDNAINRRVLTELLRRRGLEVDFAVNGLEGFQRITAVAGSDEAFNVVFMDMHMPVQDGYTTARCLKEHGGAPPIIALTASALKEDRDRCIDAGCDAYLPKPVDNALLDSLLARYVAPAAEAMDQTSP
ncbi:MAG: response regulator [Planctomycetes bacterium]|nr:response regulator [Planctomycetota bacterium]